MRLVVFITFFEWKQYEWMYYNGKLNVPLTKLYDEYEGLFTNYYGEKITIQRINDIPFGSVKKRS